MKFSLKDCGIVGQLILIVTSGRKVKIFQSFNFDF